MSVQDMSTHQLHNHPRYSLLFHTIPRFPPPSIPPLTTSRPPGGSLQAHPISHPDTESPLTEASALPSVSPVLGGCAGGGGGGAAPLYMPGEPADMCGDTAVGVDEGGARNDDMDGRLEAMSPPPPPPHTCRRHGPRPVRRTPAVGWGLRAC